MEENVIKVSGLFWRAREKFNMVMAARSKNSKVVEAKRAVEFVQVFDEIRMSRVLKVKRRACEDPPEELVIAAKRLKTDALATLWKPGEEETQKTSKTATTSRKRVHFHIEEVEEVVEVSGTKKPLMIAEEVRVNCLIYLTGKC